MSDAFRVVRSPGRLEVVGHAPLILLDGAHNVAGAHALQSALAEEFPESPRTLVIGLLREKEPHEMLDALDAKHAARLLCCRPPSPRALDPASVAAAGYRGMYSTNLMTNPAAIRTSLKQGDQFRALVTYRRLLFRRTLTVSTEIGEVMAAVQLTAPPPPPSAA